MIKKLLVILLMAVGTLSAMADTSISLSEATGRVGDEVEMTISLNSDDNVAVAEIMVPLNRYLKYVDGSCTINSERSNGHQVSAAMVNDSLRIYIYNVTGDPLKGTDGTLCTFKLKLGKSSSKFMLTPKVLLASPTGEEVACAVTAGMVTIKAPYLYLYTSALSYGKVAIRGQYTKTITISNTGTSLLTVSDVQFSESTLSGEKQFTIEAGSAKNYVITYEPTVSGTLNGKMTIISDATNGKQNITITAQPYSVNELHVGNANGNSDEEVEIKLDMNNMERIVAMQCSFTMPSGLEYVDGSLKTADRSSQLTSAAVMEGNKLTLYLVSPQNAPVSGESGTICSFKVKLNGTTGSYSLSPTNVILAVESEENVVTATTSGTVTISSPKFSGSSTLDLGNAAVGEKQSVTYSISNNSQIPLTINKVTFLQDGYSINEELPQTIAAYGSTTLTVNYTPTAAGDITVQMNVYTNDPDNRMKTITITGKAYEPNVLSISRKESADLTKCVFDVSMANYSTITALQMDLHWIPEMTTSQDLVKLTSRLEGLSYTLKNIGDGVYRLLFYSFDNKTVGGNEGELFSITYNNSNEIDYRGTQFYIDNVILGRGDGVNMKSGDAEVSFNLPPKTFYLTYILDGKEMSKDEFKVGDALTPKDNPTKEGYTFSGWSEIPATMPAKNVEVTGTFTVNKYKLVYMLDGTEYKSSEVEFGTPLTAIEDPSNEGKTFSGWSEIPATMPAKDVTITGSFTVNKYKLVYMLDGKEYKSSEVEYGKALTEIDAPSKEGYTFSGWREIPSTMPAKDVTITGSFTVNKYKLVYMVDGKEYNSSEVEYGTTLTAIDAPSKEGFTFSGWSEIPATMPAKDVEVTGTFTVNKYKLIYMVDGKEYNSSEVEYGTTLTAIDAPSKEGYTFSGWSEIPATMPAKDVEVTGTFTVNKYKLVYMLDDEEYNSSEVEYGTTLTAIDAPSKEGYTFSGWSEIPSMMPAKDVEVIGTFTVNKYKLVYMLDDEEYNSSEVEYGTTLTAIDAPSKEGYTFSGWSEIPSMMPAKNVTVTGTFTVNNYKLVYMVDDEEYNSSEVEYGTTLTAIDAPSKEGYTFLGWSEIPATMPAKDVEVTGSFKVNTYTITYKVDGEVYKTEDANYGSAISLIDNPTKEGCTFSGWSEVPSTMPANDIEVSGSFTKNSADEDINEDGNVDSQDVLKVYDYMKTSTEKPTSSTREDVNHDGNVDSQDVLKIYDYMKSH